MRGNHTKLGRVRNVKTQQEKRRSLLGLKIERDFRLERCQENEQEKEVELI